MFDNPAARSLTRKLINATSVQNPVLLTEGMLGFEVLNHITNVAAGAMAGNAFPREVWLCALPCEDRAVVRKR